MFKKILLVAVVALLLAFVPGCTVTRTQPGATPTPQATPGIGALGAPAALPTGAPGIKGAPAATPGAKVQAVIKAGTETAAPRIDAPHQKFKLTKGTTTRYYDTATQASLDFFGGTWPTGITKEMTWWSIVALNSGDPKKAVGPSSWPEGMELELPLSAEEVQADVNWVARQITGEQTDALWGGWGRCARIVLNGFYCYHPETTLDEQSKVYVTVPISIPPLPKPSPKPTKDP